MQRRAAGSRLALGALALGLGLLAGLAVLVAVALLDEIAPWRILLVGEFVLPFGLTFSPPLRFPPQWNDGPVLGGALLVALAVSGAVVGMTWRRRRS